MNRNSRVTFCVMAVSVFTFVVGSAANADTPAFTSGGSTTVPPPSFEGTRGWSFFNYSPGGDILISQLGVYDAGGDGLANSHQVGLWSLDGTLLGSATVPAGTGGLLVDGYRYVSISPVTIPRATSNFDPRTAFIIAAQYSVGDPDDLVTPDYSRLAPGIGAWSGSWGGFTDSIGWYGFGANLPFPNNRTPPASEGGIGPGFWEPNFQFGPVPEPSTWLLLGSGLLAVRLLRRRK